jgi:hypothetical protein
LDRSEASFVGRSPNNQSLDRSISYRTGTQAITNVSNEGAITDANLEVWRGRVEKDKQNVAADLARRAARPQNMPFPLEAYAGDYDNELYGRLQISVVNGKLEARLGQAWSAVEVFDNTTNRLRVELFGSGQVMDVEMKDGRAAAMNLGGIVFSSRR